MYQKFIQIMLIVLLGMSCHQSRLVEKSTPDDVITIQPTTDIYTLLDGNWRLTGYQPYMSSEDMDKIPDFSTQKVIYNFDLDNNNLVVTRDQKMTKDDYALPAGDHRFWFNESMIKLGESLYMYRIVGNVLKLDSNYDPSIGPDGIVYSFVSAD